MLLPNLCSLWFLAHRARAAFGRRVAATALLFTATQFHTMYYASRTLPNMIAFPFGTSFFSTPDTLPRPRADLCASGCPRPLLTRPPAVQVALGLLLFPQGRRRLHDSGKTKGTYYEVLAALGLLVFVAVVLRLEVGALVVGVGLWGLWAKTVRVAELVAVGVVAGGASQGKPGMTADKSKVPCRILTWFVAVVQP